MAAIPLPSATAQASDPLAAAAASGDWARTEQLARAAVAGDHRSVAAWTYLGLAQDHNGHKREALHSLAEAVRLAPNATFAHNNYGAALEANGQAPAAMAEYRRSLALDRSQPAALINLARLESAAGTAQGRDQARELLRSAWAIAPDLEVGRSLLLLAPCAQRVAPLRTPVADVQPYGDAIAAEAGNVPAPDRVRLGRALLACGLSADAGKLAAATLADTPRDPEALVLRAQAQRAAGENAAAGRTLEQAVADGIESPAVYAELSGIYQDTAHMDNAVSAMRRALALAPGDDRLQFRYGMLLLDAHAPKAAELRMREAVTRSPSSARLWFVLGLAQFDQTRPGDAQVSFDHALSLEPGFAPALAYRGLAALDQQHYSEAEGWYRKAIAADPDAADLHVLLAEALERQNPAGTAAMRAELNKALAIDPRLASAHLALGRLDLQDGDPAAARDALQTTLQLDPALLQAHFYLARAYRQLHQPELAASEGKLFSEQQAAAETADRAALQGAVRQLAHTAF